MKQIHDMKAFLKYVLPSVLSFALSGVYAIIDGFFIGNSMGDIGLSTINVAYPIVALIQALGTGLGMGGAIYYSISHAEKKEAEAKEYTATAFWLLIFSSFFTSIIILLMNDSLLKLLGANAQLLILGHEYLVIIALGAGLQIMSTGLVPFIRNHGGSAYAMISMMAGFITNIILDYRYVWIFNQGVRGAAFATVIGQGVTMLMALAYLIWYRQLSFRVMLPNIMKSSLSILKVGIAPFGLVMTPNIVLMMINRFSILYGGEKAVAVYACIAYVMCILDLILQGVGDGSQPLISWYYGKKDYTQMKHIRKLAYEFSIVLSLIGCIIMYFEKAHIGILFGSSNEVNREIIFVLPIFLLSAPFAAYTRITIASFYATEESTFSYLLTFSEPFFLFLFILLLPPLWGGQRMIWWSSVFARIGSALFAFILQRYLDQQNSLN